jgi:hypothetical protein
MLLDESAHLVAQRVNVRFLDEAFDLLEFFGREIVEAGPSQRPLRRAALASTLSLSVAFSPTGCLRFSSRSLNAS